MREGTGAAVMDRPHTLPRNDSEPTAAASPTAATPSQESCFAEPPDAEPPDAEPPDAEPCFAGWSVPSRPCYAFSDQELVTELDQVFAAEQRLAARRLALIAEIDARGLAVREGARNTTGWLHERLRLDTGHARQWLRLARALSTELPATAHALADGQIHQDQAQVIDKALSHLPDTVGAAIRGQAEQALIEFAGTFAPSPLAALGDRILDHVAPEVAEEHQRRQLEREEARARQQRCFSLTPHGLARHRLTGWLDNESAATVNAALNALCTPPSTSDNPHEPDNNTPPSNESAGNQSTGNQSTGNQSTGNEGDGGEAVGMGQRRADALVQLCRMALAGGGSLPTHGGQRPQVIVTMPFRPWQEAIAEAMGTLADGRKVTPETLRRMACDAHLTPVVLGGQGEVLDVGRAYRLVTSAIRKALHIRDRGCCFPACDRPVAWTDAHHLTHWVNGGVTSLDNCVLLCRKHHVIVHEGQWQVRLGADRLPEFIPPSYVDPLRRPLRNQYHRRT